MPITCSSTTALFFPQQWRETSYRHEFAHIVQNRFGRAIRSQSAEGELLAYLTELKYGETLYYSLYNIFYVGAIENRQPHGQAMRIIYTEFARRIVELNRRNEGFAQIDCGRVNEIPTSDDINRISFQFPKLSEEEIRSLAGYVFELKCRHLLEHAPGG